MVKPKVRREGTSCGVRETGEDVGRETTVLQGGRVGV